MAALEKRVLARASKLAAEGREIINLGIGQQTPPVASVLVTACSVAKADIWEVSKVNVFFVAVLLAVLLLVTYVPAVPMVLVEMFYR